MLTASYFSSILSSILPSNRLLRRVYRIAPVPRLHHLIQFRLTDFEMANNTIWQVSHYLVIVVHLIMFVAGIATFVSNGKNLNTSSVSSVASLNADFDAKTIVWAVGGVVSSLPPPPSRHSQKKANTHKLVYPGHRWSHMHGLHLLAPPLSPACVASGDHTRSVLSQAQDRLHFQHSPTGLPRHR